MPNMTPGLCRCGCGGRTNPAATTNSKHGWVRGEPMPYLLNHRTRANEWTEIEDQRLSDMYATASAFAIGRRLGRSESAVWRRARFLGLGKRIEAHGPWTDDELALLTRQYSLEPATAVAQRLGRTPSAVTQQARYLGLVSNKTEITQSSIGDYFRRIDTAEKAYILGLLAADGNVSDRGRISLGLQVKDGDLLRFVRDRLAPRHVITTTEARGFASFGFTSHEAVADLAKWGVVPRKSRTVQWPTALGTFQRLYLLGYFDGDGSAFVIRDRYPGWSVCSGSRALLEGLKDYVLTATGVELGKIMHRPNADLYEVGTSGSGAYVVDEWLHQDGLGLDRKRFSAAVLDRYRAPVVEGRTRNGLASWTFTAEFKATAVAALRRARKADGVVHGDVTRVAAEIGVDRQNLRRWAIEADLD